MHFNVSQICCHKSVDLLTGYPVLLHDFSITVHSIVNTKARRCFHTYYQLAKAVIAVIVIIKELSDLTDGITFTLFTYLMHLLHPIHGI